MKAADLVVGNVYAMRENSYGPFKPIVVLDTRRVQRSLGFGTSSVLSCPASMNKSGYNSIKGILAHIVDNNAADMVAWIQTGQDPKQNPKVLEAKEKLASFIESINPRTVAEFRLDFGKGEWPSGLSIVRPQTIIGDYVETIIEEVRRTDTATARRQAEQKKAREILEQLQQAHSSIKASLTDFGDEEVPLKGWHQANGNEVRIPITDLTIIAESLAAALGKIKENR